MAFYIDQSQITPDQYKDTLKAANLVKSRMVLKDNIDANFDRIETCGVKNIEDLLNRIKDKNKLQEFATESGVSEEYLTILSREIRSDRQKPTKLAEFPDTKAAVIHALEKLGIKDALQLYERILTPESRAEFAKEVGVDNADILRLAKLIDLTRIRWVNHTFAYVLYEAGYDTVEAISKADYRQLYDTIKKLNKERELYKGAVGLNDMKLLVDFAGQVSIDVIY